MDLTKTAPRSVHETFLGIVQLARTMDKAKALVHGNIGEYNYDCPMDNGLFDFLGMDSAKYLEFVKHAKSDAEIEAYLKGYLAKKTPQEIEGFNKQWLATTPTGESLEHFVELRTRIAPDRTDVKTWPDLLDLDEGRQIPRRQAVTA